MPLETAPTDAQRSKALFALCHAAGMDEELASVQATLLMEERENPHFLKTVLRAWGRCFAIIVYDILNCKSEFDLSCEDARQRLEDVFGGNAALKFSRIMNDSNVGYRRIRLAK